MFLVLSDFAFKQQCLEKHINISQETSVTGISKEYFLIAQSLLGAIQRAFKLGAFKHVCAFIYKRDTLLCLNEHSQRKEK